MNREIKFRSWVDNGAIAEMHYPNDIEINSPDGVSFQWKVGFEDAHPKENNISKWQKNIIWMQFTGFKDFDGKEIYEGDILQDCIKDENTGQIIESKETVYFDETTGSWMLDNSYKQDQTYGTSLFQNLIDFEYKIVGNKFENPELLNNK